VEGAPRAIERVAAWAAFALTFVYILILVGSLQGGWTGYTNAVLLFAQLALFAYIMLRFRTLLGDSADARPARASITVLVVLNAVRTLALSSIGFVYVGVNGPELSGFPVLGLYLVAFLSYGLAFSALAWSLRRLPHPPPRPFRAYWIWTFVTAAMFASFFLGGLAAAAQAVSSVLLGLVFLRLGEAQKPRSA